MALGATFQPTTLAQALQFGLLVDPPTRETTQSVSERVIPGSNDSVIDVVGKTVTKIRGKARIDGFQALKTFEGAVGSLGTLVYSEEPTGIQVLFIALVRTYVQPVSFINLCDIEFWVIPNDAVLSGF